MKVSKKPQNVLEKCSGNDHVMATFTCQSDTCGTSRLICKKCAKYSEKSPGSLICKQCFIAQEDSDEDSDDGIDYAAEAAKPSDFKLIATVSYNREKRDFEYDNFKQDAFEGADSISKGAYAEKAPAIH